LRGFELHAADLHTWGLYLRYVILFLLLLFILILHHEILCLLRRSIALDIMRPILIHGLLGLNGLLADAGLAFL
jgi:hypothetical protein